MLKARGSPRLWIVTVVLGVALALPVDAGAQRKDINVGVIFDYSGKLAATSETAAAGTKIAIDMINERGGVEGYKINAIYADAQSKPKVAIKEAERLFDKEKADLLMGVYSSSQCVPLAPKLDAKKRFFWANVCIASKVFKDRNLKYVFRAQAQSDVFGLIAPDFLAAYSKEKLGIDPKDLRVAIIYRDAAAGRGVSKGNAIGAKKHGMQVVLNEGFDKASTDQAPLVAKLKAVNADVVLHGGQLAQVISFLSEARKADLRVKAIIGQGGGYNLYEKLIAKFGDDVNHIFNVAPVAAELLSSKSLAPGLGDVTAEMVRRYKAEMKTDKVPPYASMGFNQSWIFLTDALPRAIKKYGGYDAEALRKAAMDTDIPEGGTVQGYGVKFYPPGHSMAGQNMRAAPVVMQFVGGETKVVWPKSLQTAEPVLPLPTTSPYALK